MRAHLMFKTGVFTAFLAVLAIPACAQLSESPSHQRIQQRTYHFDEAGAHELPQPRRGDGTGGPLEVHA